jgi:DNA-binding protein Fis
LPASTDYIANDKNEQRKYPGSSPEEPEEYFNDLGEQQASNIYDMVVLTVKNRYWKW